jgi:hypothetical protein
VETAFRRDLARLPLTLSPAADGFDPALLAAALADRLRLRFGAMASQPRPDGAPALLLPADDPALEGLMTWNLAEPVVAPRSRVIAFDPLAAPRALAARDGADAVVSETTVPAISTGFHRVGLTANLPKPRAGLAGLMATLRFPAAPPARPQEIRRTIAIAPPADGGDVDVRLAPGEACAWRLSARAVLSRPGGADILEGAELAGTGEQALLDAAMLPVRFIEIEAGPALTALADVEGEVLGSRAGAAWRASFRLTAAAPTVALALARDLAEAILRLSAVPRDGGTAIALAPVPVRDLHVDLHLFPGYGPQRIVIACAFAPGQELAAIDLRGETEPEAAAETLSFTPGAVEREWRWLSPSPFRPGVCWRWHRTSQPGGPWSPPLPPGGRLEIDAGKKPVLNEQGAGT